jgi:hypothetical protein
MAWRKSGLLRLIKNAVVPSGSKPRVILTGAFKGIRLDLDLRSNSQMYAGFFERELYSDLARLSRGIRTAVDIGAAHGEYSIYALLKTGAARVIAFEPDPAFIPQLHRNLQLNGLEQNPRFELQTKYLGSVATTDTISADSLADWIQPPCLLKMDIEGGELDVLRASMTRLLSVQGLRWIIEAHSEAIREESLSILKSSGYKTKFIPQAWWRFLLPELRGTKVGWIVATR